MKYIIMLLGLLLGFQGIAQGTVNVNASATISQMMDQFTSTNKAENTIKGWRIQIITTNNRRKMEAARSKFLSMYPDIDVIWNHVAPYYRVKVGAYETKMQLMGFLLELKEEFPGVIPVMDNVNKSELIGY
ncbi:MAG: SPOR domain-containing protein [Bacteroidota bacterium]